MRNSFWLLMVVLIATACVPQKDVVYLQDDVENKFIDSEHQVQKDRQVIQPFDEVYIEVASTDREGSNFLEQQRGGMYSANSPEALSIISYRVDDKGNVNLPVIGKIRISGYTLEEAADFMQSQLEEYLYQPSVKINFVNKSITLIGFVYRPGRYYYSSDHINIFQALGMAGDIQEFGNRKRVLIIREIDNRTTKTLVDLTSESIIDSQYYYLRSNDVVYVEPLKRRWWGMNTFPFALLLSSVTTFILVMDYIQRD